MTWLRLLCFTFGVSVAFGLLDVGQAGGIHDRMMETRGLTAMPRYNTDIFNNRPTFNSVPSDVTPGILNGLRDDVLLQPSYVDPSFSGTLQARCATACGIHKGARGAWVPDYGCTWVDPHNNEDLRVLCK